MLSEAERTDARRHCGYPARGAAAGWGTPDGVLDRLTPQEEAVLRTHLAELGRLERAVPAAGEAMDTDEAAGWRRNRSEPTDRLRLLDTWRLRLCSFLGVRPGPGLAGGGTLRLVV